MANPPIPPDIAKKIAAMAKPAPAPAAAPGPAKAPAAPAKAAARPAGGASTAGKLAAVGWILAVVGIAAAVGEVMVAEGQKKAALEAQAAEYEAKLAQVTADAAAKVKLAEDTAASKLSSMQVDLDFARLPEFPLKMEFRTGGVLFVDNQANPESFYCKVRLQRPGSPTSRELDFVIKGKTFQDIGAIEDWVFQKGDNVEFVKPGFKPRSLVVP